MKIRQFKQPLSYLFTTKLEKLRLIFDFGNCKSRHVVPERKNKAVDTVWGGENGKVTGRQRHLSKRNAPRDMMGFLNRSHNREKSHHISRGWIDTDTAREPNVFMWYKTTSQHTTQILHTYVRSHNSTTDASRARRQQQHSRDFFSSFFFFLYFRSAATTLLFAARLIRFLYTFHVAEYSNVGKGKVNVCFA
jgi:hypothetical protein